MRELPRQLTADELAELFEGHTRFVERLADEEDPLVRARTLVHELPADEKKEILDAHPAIGAHTGLSARSAAEQGADADPAVLDELARLNAEYEARHGFRFVVFVDRRPKAEILDGAEVEDRQSDEPGAGDGARRARRDRGGPLVLAVDPYLIGWLDLVFRWFHVAAAIVWIGTSFYFVALDNHLREPEDARDRERGVGGETWEIHGGGFYRVDKFRVAPAQLPETLHWYKWEAYWTWISGFTLLVVLYYLEPRTYLIDPTVASLAPWEAIAISLAGLAIGWVVYDLLCRTIGRRSELALAALMLVLVAVTAYGASLLFAPQAAYLEVGAMLGTIMVANVFFETDENGRARLADDLEPGVYRIAFSPPSPFFTRVELEVVLADEHYHVPLLISPYGCASYRGS